MVIYAIQQFKKGKKIRQSDREKEGINKKKIKREKEIKEKEKEREQLMHTSSNKSIIPTIISH